MTHDVLFVLVLSLVVLDRIIHMVEISKRYVYCQCCLFLQITPTHLGKCIRIQAEIKQYDEIDKGRLTKTLGREATGVRIGLTRRTIR